MARPASEMPVNQTAILLRSLSDTQKLLEKSEQTLSAAQQEIKILRVAHNLDQEEIKRLREENARLQAGNALSVLDGQAESKELHENRLSQSFIPSFRSQVMNAGPFANQLQPKKFQFNKDIIDIYVSDDLTVWLNTRDEQNEFSLEAWGLKMQTLLQKRTNCQLLTWLANGYRVISSSGEYSQVDDTFHMLKIEYHNGEVWFEMPLDGEYSNDTAYFGLPNKQFLVLMAEQNQIGILDTATTSTKFIQAPKDIDLNISAFLKEGSIVSRGKGPDRCSAEIVIWNYEKNTYDFSMDCGVPCNRLVALSDSTFVGIGYLEVEDDTTFVSVFNMADRGQTEARSLQFKNQIHFNVLPDGTLLTQERGTTGTLNLWELQEGKLLKTIVNPDIRSLNCVHQTQTTLYIASDKTLFAYDRSELGMANKPKGLRF